MPGSETAGLVTSTIGNVATPMNDDPNRLDGQTDQTIPRHPASSRPPPAHAGAAPVAVPSRTRTIVQADLKAVRLVVEAQNADARSSQFSCVVRVENGSDKLLRVVSLRPFNPFGTEVQQVIDTAQSEPRFRRDRLYQHMSVLLNNFLVSSSADYRKKSLELVQEHMAKSLSPRSVGYFYYSLIRQGMNATMRQLTGNMGAWTIEIRSVERAEYYFKTFLEANEGASIELRKIYVAKMEDARVLEAELGNGSLDNLVDIEPGGSFSRTYVYNCNRYGLNPRTYTFSFDCSYVTVSDQKTPDTTKGTETKHVAGTIAAAISPKPLVLNFIAVTAAILGTVLRMSLNPWKSVNGELGSDGFLQYLTFDLIYQHPSYGFAAAGAAMITALFFYNVYDSTDIGRKLDVGTGWRSALIIGGLSGLLTDRIILALKGLLGGH